MSNENTLMAGLFRADGSTLLEKGKQSGFLSQRNITFLVAAVFLGAMGATAWVSIQNLERHHRSDMGQDLTTVVTSASSALEEWVKEKITFVESYSHSELIEDAVSAISGKKGQPLTLDDRKRISQRIHKTISNSGDTEISTHFHILSRENLNLFSSYPDEVDTVLNIPRNRMMYINQVWQGESRFVPPYIKQSSGAEGKEVAVLLIATPIEVEGRVAAIAVLELDSRQAFSRFAATGRLGETGETYFFDQQATLLTESRFNSQLEDVGLIKPGTFSALSIKIKDPLVNLLSGEQPTVNRDEWPLTKMSKSAVAGESGSNTDGYRDYRGVSVFGVWIWDDRLGIGMTAEIGEFEAMSKYRYVRTVIVLVCIASTLISAGMFLVVFLLGRGLDSMTRRSARFDRILEGSLNEIYVFDDETYKFIQVNRGARRNLGYSMEEMEGLTAWSINPVIEEQRFREIVQPLIDGKEDVLVFEAVHQRKIGTCYPVEVHLQLFTDENPAVFVAIIMDISERKDVEAAITKLNQDLEGRVEQRTAELEKANDELGDTLENLQQMQGQLVENEKMVALGGLVAGIAHEINTPVGIGVTAISHLKEENEIIEQAFQKGTMKRSDLEAYVSKSSEAVSIVDSNLRRASDLIRSFRNVAVDQMSEEPREFALEEYLEEVLLSLRPKLKQGNHTIELDCDSSLHLLGQPGLFSQIVTNLIMNSLIHAFDETESGQMSLSCHQVGDEIEMCYRDSGKGIPESQVSKIFDPFFTTRRGQGGSGLGLHIIYNLVTQKLGGTISCDSEVGRGTDFTVKFPAS